MSDDTYCTACRSVIQVNGSGCTADSVEWNKAVKRLEAELRGGTTGAGIGPFFTRRSQVLDGQGNPMFAKEGE